MPKTTLTSSAYPSVFWKPTHTSCLGGMRQRVAIALAALLRPSVIFADEPTTALDVVVQRGVVQLLKDIQADLHNTIILVTHDMGIHANVTDRLAIMYATG